MTDAHTIALLVLATVFGALLYEVRALRRFGLMLGERLDTLNRRVLTLELDSHERDRDSGSPPSLKPTKLKAPPPAGGAA